MSGHSHWKQIQRKKTATDEKRGRLFSKLLNAVSIAARGDPNPDFNPRLKRAVEYAKEYGVPQENIDRAIKKAAETGENLTELFLGAYGPGGAALKIEVITDNKNRAISEIKNLLNEHGGKWAEAGAVDWTFEKTADGWKPKFTQDVNPADKEKLKELITALEKYDDIQKVYSNLP